MTQYKHFFQYHNLLRNSRLNVISAGGLYETGDLATVTVITNSPKVFGAGGAELVKLSPYGFNTLIKCKSGTNLGNIYEYIGNNDVMRYEFPLDDPDPSTWIRVDRCNEDNDNYGPDYWGKSETLKIYREYRGPNTLIGNQYSLKCVKGDSTSEQLCYPDFSMYDKMAWYTKFQGRKVCFAAWVKTSSNSCARLKISDNISYSTSSYHSGGGSFEWLEVSYTVNSNATEFKVSLELDGNIDDYAHITHPMLVYGDTIGEGNWFPLERERIFFNFSQEYIETFTALSTNTGTENRSLQAMSMGIVPIEWLSVMLRCDINTEGNRSISTFNDYSGAFFWYTPYPTNTSSSEMFYGFHNSNMGITSGLRHNTGEFSSSTSAYIRTQRPVAGITTTDSVIFRFLGIELERPEFSFTPYFR